MTDHNNSNDRDDMDDDVELLDVLKELIEHMAKNNDATDDLIVLANNQMNYLSEKYPDCDDNYVTTLSGIRIRVK